MTPIMGEETLCLCSKVWYLNVLVPAADGFEQVLDLGLVLLCLMAAVTQQVLDQLLLQR